MWKYENARPDQGPFGRVQMKLNVNSKAVVSKVHTLGQACLYLGMQPQLVADVREVSVLSAHFFGDLYGLGKGVVAYMLAMAQRIDDEGFAAADLVEFGRGNVVGIGDIGEVADAESEDLHLIVQGAYGYDIEAIDRERAAVDGVEIHLRNAGVGVFLEDIGEFATQRLLRGYRCIDLHSLLLQVVVGPHIVEPGSMVFVPMREDNGIQMTHARAQHLVAEVGPGVDNNAGLRRMHIYRRAQAVVARVGGGTYRTGATYERYALGGAGAKECDFHRVRYPFRFVSWCRYRQSVSQSVAYTISAYRCSAPPRSHRWWAVSR